MHSALTSLLCLSAFLTVAQAVRPGQNVKATITHTKTGEQVVTVEAIFKPPPASVWKWFSTEEGYKCWAAPVVRLDLRTGGKLETNYNKSAAIGDPGTISLDILNYVETEVLTFKVKLNESFSDRLRSEDDKLQEIIQLQRLPGGGTRMVSSMVGWGTGPDWDKAVAFFARGNEWTYKNLSVCVSGGKPSME